MKKMSKSTRKNVVLSCGATSDTTRDRFRARYQCYSDNPDVLRALVARELPEKTDLAVRGHVWNCGRCRSEYSKLKAEWVAEATASPALNLSSENPVNETTDSDIGSKPQTTRVEEADFRRLLEQLLSGQQTIEALLLNPVFQRRVRTIGQTFARNDADVEDLSNYVRLAVCNRLRQFKPNDKKPYGDFFRWVAVIARNKVIADLRGKSFRPTSFRQGQLEGFSVPDKVDMEAEIERGEVVERFWVFVGKLDPVKQKIMHYLMEANSFRQIGEKLAMEGIRLSHVTIGEVVRDVMADFFAKENALLTGKIARKPNYRAPRRESSDRESGDSSARKTGS